MSLSGIMNTALTGLFTSQSALSTTSSNIANVNTPGYARQVVKQEPIVAGSSPAGVKIADVQRVVDQFLEASALTSSGDANRYSMERRFHDRLQALMGQPDKNTSLSGRLDTMFEKLGAVAQDPTKLVLRQDALSGIENFVNEISRLSDEVQRLRADASNQISEQVSNINRILERVDKLNTEIVKEKSTGRPAGALEEQRAQALSELAEMVDVRVNQQPSGAVQVTTTNGTALLGANRVELRYEAPGVVTSETRFSSITVHNVDPTSGNVSPNGSPLDGNVAGGQIAGLLNMRDNTLPDMALELGRLGATVLDQVNAIHNENVAYPAPNSMEGRNTGLLGTDGHGFTGEAAFAITDATGTVVARADVDFDALPAGATIDDMIATVNAGLGGAGTLSMTNGRLAFTATNPGNGVSVVQDPNDPASRGGMGVSHFFGLNDLLQSKVPGTYNTGFQGTDPHGFTPGSTVSFSVVGKDNKVIASPLVTVPAGDFDALLGELNDPGGLGQYFDFSLGSDGQLQVEPKPGLPPVDLHVNAEQTSRGGTGVSLSGLFGIGDRYLMDAASGMKVHPAISGNPERLSLGTFDHAAGVGQYALAAGNNEGGQALQALNLTSQSFAATGKLGNFSGTLAQYGASILANMGLLADQVTSRETDTRALADEVARRRSDVSGVNMDEELSNMVIFQNAYNSSARIMTTVREMYDTLLGVV